MYLRLQQHPLRHAATDEMFARTYDSVQPPMRACHFVIQCGERGTGQNSGHLLKLLEHFAVERPKRLSQWHACMLTDELHLRWERHTEFVSYTLSKPGAFNHPFLNPLVNELPQDWLAEIPGVLVSAINLALESNDQPPRGLEEIGQLFDGNPIIGSEVAGGAGLAWSDMRIHNDGFSRVLLRDCGLSHSQAGRLLKRIIEIKSYRAMTMLGLPEARVAGITLGKADSQLATLAARMATQHAQNADHVTEQELLNELTSLAVEVERVVAHTAYRFDATQAYYDVVRKRLEQLRQHRIEGLQTFTEFLDARLAPAVATCQATAQRQHDLGERAARLTSLLRARVEVALHESNRDLLKSMDRRARIQLRLQETVEGLSVVAIAYYGVGLLGYLFKGLESKGLLPISATLALGISVPLVVLGAWASIRVVKARLLGPEH